MRRIELEGTRMSRLVEDLLVLARGDQDSMLEVTEVSVDALMEEAATAVQVAHPERAIEVGRPTGLVMLGDWDQLLRVLINLTTNAAVHTPDGPIRLTAAPSTMGVPTGTVPAVTLQVSDTGPGLPPEQSMHVFERFWRADKARSRAKGGSGLGMAIVAQIVQAHGGWVRFDSSVEAGTTVTVMIPAAPPPWPDQSGYQDEPEYQDESPYQDGAGYQDEPGYQGPPAGYQGPPPQYQAPPPGHPHDPAVPVAGPPGPTG
jgi:two-component system OmpR family sensor kinase